MVFEKIKQAITGNDEKYEILYYKYSKIKLENSKLKDKHQADMKQHKGSVHLKVAKDLIKVFESVETAKNDSFKVKVNDKEIQQLLMSVNSVEKNLKKLMTDFSLEQISGDSRFYDPEIHEVASYEDAKGMAKGLLLKTSKKGFKYRGEIIKKPRVVVTK